MRIKDVVTLKEVVSDLNDGKAFYYQRESWKKEANRVRRSFSLPQHRGLRVRTGRFTKLIGP